MTSEFDDHRVDLDRVQAVVAFSLEHSVRWVDVEMMLAEGILTQYAGTAGSVLLLAEGLSVEEALKACQVIEKMKRRKVTTRDMRSTQIDWDVVYTKRGT